MKNENIIKALNICKINYGGPSSVYIGTNYNAYNQHYFGSNVCTITIDLLQTTRYTTPNTSQQTLFELKSGIKVLKQVSSTHTANSSNYQEKRFLNIVTNSGASSIGWTSYKLSGNGSYSHSGRISFNEELPSSSSEIEIK